MLRIAFAILAFFFVLGTANASAPFVSFPVNVTASSAISLTAASGSMPIPLNGSISYTIVQSGCSSFSIGSNSSTGVVYTAISGTTLGLIAEGTGSATVILDGCNNATLTIPVTVGSATPSPSPTGSSSALVAYSSISGNTPPGGVYAYYPSSPYHVPLPSSPALATSAQITQWNNDQSPSHWGDINISEDASNGNDGGDPTYFTDGDGNSITLICALNSAGSVGKYYCDNSLSTYHNSIIEFWNNSGNCPDSAFSGNNYGCPQGQTVSVPPNSVAEAGSDHHAIFINTTGTVNGVTGYEIDFWGDGTISPASAPSSGTWTVAALGACNLHGDGTACSDSYATNIAGSLGLIRAEDILYCLTGAGSSNANCVLPMAISVAPKCNGSNYTYPASASDGQCGAGGTANSTYTNRIPEGTRGFINETDAQVNAETISAYGKVIRRTMDKQHYGFFIRDTNYYGGPGIVFQYQPGSAYVAMNKTDPWRTLYNYEVNQGEASTYIQTSDGGLYMTFDVGTNSSSESIVNNVEWCANSHSDGLCD